MNLIEENFITSTNGKVVRIGDTVHREVRGKPILHLYLQYLEEAGMKGVPRFLGLDDQGREILTYLPGKTQEYDDLVGHPCIRADNTIIDMAKFMRKLHDLSVGFIPEALKNGWINPDYPGGDPETICHNDAATWNWTFMNDRITGLFDFDNACAGTRLWDLTLPVFSVVPITPYVYDTESDSYIKYSRLKHANERRRRIALFFDAYGMKCSPEFLDLLFLRMIDFCKHSAGAELVWYMKVVTHIKETEQDWNL